MLRKITMTLLVALTVAAVPLAAQRAPLTAPGGGGSSALPPDVGLAGTAGFCEIDGEEVVEPGRLLFYRFPDGILPADEVEVESRVFIDGEPTLTELLRVAPAEEGRDPVIELLGWHREQLDRLFAVAAEGRRVEVEIGVVGAEARRVPFVELLEASEELLQTSFQPRQARGYLTGAGSEGDLFLSQRTTCSECYENYDQCIADCINGPSGACDFCETGLEFCLDDCDPPPPNCPTVEERVVTEFLNFLIISAWECHPDVFFPNDPKHFHFTQRNFKRTRYEVTTHCDGSETRVVLGVTYPSDLCYYRLSFSCNFPQSPFPPNCWFQ